MIKILKVFLAAEIAAAGLSGQTDWPAYGHDPSAQRFSPLTQINTKNVARLKLAWQYGNDPAGVDLNPTTRALTATEAVPIMVDGVLFTPTVHHTIVAL